MWCCSSERCSGFEEEMSPAQDPKTTHDLQREWGDKVPRRGGTVQPPQRVGRCRKVGLRYQGLRVDTLHEAVWPWLVSAAR